MSDPYALLAETLLPDEELIRRRAIRAAINPDGTVNRSALRTSLILPIPPFEIAGVLSVGTDVAQTRRVPMNATLKLLEAQVRTAPVGSEATFVLAIDGVAGPAVTITEGTLSGTSPISVAVTAGQVLTLNVTREGTTTPAENATISVTYSPSGT